MAADPVAALTELRGNSTEKVLTFIAYLSDLSDDELAQALPVASPMMTRMALAAAAGRVSPDPDELDGQLERVAELCTALRSD